MSEKKKEEAAAAQGLAKGSREGSGAIHQLSLSRKMLFRLQEHLALGRKRTSPWWPQNCHQEVKILWISRSEGQPGATGGKGSICGGSLIIPSTFSFFLSFLKSNHFIQRLGERPEVHTAVLLRADLEVTRPLITIRGHPAQFIKEAMEGVKGHRDQDTETGSASTGPEPRSRRNPRTLTSRGRSLKRLAEGREGRPVIASQTQLAPNKDSN